MIQISSSGDFKNTENFLNKMTRNDVFKFLSVYGQEGVLALARTTPVDTGKTALSWRYEIKITPTSYSIIWNNTNVVDGVPVAILIQLGHGTKNGGYVSGIDYINPALQPIFDRITASIWREVTSS